MAVPTRITDFSTTAASNSPGGSEAIGSSLDDYMRGYQAVVRGDLAHKGADIASATTTALGDVVGFMHDITGTTGVTSLGTIAAGIHKVVKFEGALTLTHNATSLILPGGANITTADGDVGWFISEGSGNWRCLTFFKAATGALVTAASDTASGVIEIATQAEVGTGSDVVRAVTPGRLKYGAGVSKVWGYVTVSGGTPTLASSENVTGIADTSVGTVTVTIGNDFTTTSYAVTTGLEAEGHSAKISSRAAGSFVIGIYDATVTLTDSYTAFSFACHGSQV